MAKSEGQTVRVAMNGPDIEHDKLIDFSIDRNAEDRKRASSSGESRAKIKAFEDETGMNGKALSWCRQILKAADKDEGQAKAMDIILSLEKALPMVKSHVAGQGTVEMDFDSEPAEPEGDEVEPTGQEDDGFVADDPEFEAGLAQMQADEDAA